MASLDLQASLLAFLAHFSDVGVGSAAIRRPTLDQRGLQTAFTLKIILSSGAFVAAFLIAPFAHHFFQHPATGNVIRVLALDFLISTIGFMSQVTLTREQNYRALVIPGVASAVARCILAVTLILCGWKYWAVIFADVGANLAGCIAIQARKKNAHPFSIRLDRCAGIFAVRRAFARRRDPGLSDIEYG